MSVKRTLNINTFVMIGLMITPIVALNWVSTESAQFLEDNNEIYSNILIELKTIDSSLKNARFHAYAGFMHDSNLSVAHYHDHPFELHVNAEIGRASCRERVCMFV